MIENKILRIISQSMLPQYNFSIFHNEVIINTNSQEENLKTGSANALNN